MKLIYTLAANKNGKVPHETLKTCDEAAWAFSSMTREVGKIKFGIYGWIIMAIPSVCFYRRVTKTDIVYNFFLLP